MPRSAADHLAGLVGWLLVVLTILVATFFWSDDEDRSYVYKLFHGERYESPYGK